LSLVSYQYSQYSAAQIEEISVSDIRSNAEIQAHDLSNSLVNKLGDITSLVQVIGAARSVQEGNLSRAQSIFNEAKLTTSDLVDFYMWLDKDGKIVWISNLNQTAYDQYKGSDLSYRLYFSEPRMTNEVYYSSIVDSNDGVNRLYVSYPITERVSFDRSNPEGAVNLTDDGTFKGIVAASIRTDVLGNYLESQISPNLKGQVGVLDHTGIILYSKDSQYIGKNVFGVRFQSFLQSFGSETNRIVSSGFKSALEGHSGSKDISLGGKAAFVQAPIILQGKEFGVLYIIAPYAQVAEVTALIDSQKNLSVFLIAIISASAVMAAIVILRWNKSLETTIAQRTAELREANEQLMVHDKLQKEFINIAAHELRTPIQPILGMSEMLESEFGDKRDDIKMISRNARRLERLTQDILDVSKIESGSFTLNTRAIDLDELISSVITDYRNDPRLTTTGNDRRKREVKIKYEPKKVIVQADRDRIQQVISNLLSNALKFTPEGEITIRTEVKDGMAIVTVLDTGSGIDPEIRPRLFQKFASKSDKGTGLGLYISDNIIRAHGGRILAENNTDGVGSAFSFTLPLAK